MRTTDLNLTFGRILACVAISTGVAVAQSNVGDTNQIPDAPAIQTTAPETSWLDQILSFFGLASDTPSVPAGEVTVTPDVAQAPAPPPCSVDAVPVITDLDALSFEQKAGTAEVVDLDGLQPRTSRALSRFGTLVTEVGGAMTLRSAFRPAAYQAHLQAVWDRWMALRNNTEAGCAVLKNELHQEFAMHRLLETQRPVPVSDHTRGLAFDAAVTLPARARIGRRRVTLDALARMSGLVRPALIADPVHFKAIG